MTALHAAHTKLARMQPTWESSLATLMHCIFGLVADCNSYRRSGLMHRPIQYSIASLHALHASVCLNMKIATLSPGQRWTLELICVHRTVGRSQEDEENLPCIFSLIKQPTHHRRGFAASHS